MSAKCLKRETWSFFATDSGAACRRGRSVEVLKCIQQEESLSLLDGRLAGLQAVCTGPFILRRYSTPRSLPVSQPVLGNFGPLGINQINRVARSRPGADHGFPLVNVPHAFFLEIGGRVIVDDVALLGDADANHQMAGASVEAAGFEQMPGRGNDHRNSGGNPIFQFGNVAAASDVGAQVWKAARE